MTEKQQAASRANGARSRGPKTEAGRQRSSQNAVKHGICSGLVVLTNESEEHFQDHRRAYLQRFQPADPVELDLVDQMVAASWRLHRIWGIETTALEREMVRISQELEAKYEGLKQESRLCVAMQGLMEESRFLAILSRHESRIARLYHRAFQNLLTLRQSPPPATPAPEKIPQNEPEPPSPATLSAHEFIGKPSQVHVPGESQPRLVANFRTRLH